MNIKMRVSKLEQNHAITENAQDIPESLSPREHYLRLINAPLRKANKASLGCTYSPQKAYAIMIGKDHELS